MVPPLLTVLLFCSGRLRAEVLAPAPLAVVPAQPVVVSTDSARRTSLHFQTTVIDQGHARFHAPYSGPHSLLPAPDSAASVTATLFLGLKLRPGTELYLDPELAGGRGMSNTEGAAGFPNGEIFRVGDPRPAISIARIFLRQTIGFGNERESVADGQNQISGAAAARRLTVVAGRFSVADYFDNNAYSHDPRSQFLNWALMNSGAWDYPADTRGYTWGAMAEYHAPAWALRAAAVAEPEVANQLELDRRIGRANGFAIEGERQLRWGDRKGTARLLAFFNQARMGSYDEAVALAQRTGAAPDISLARAYGHTKYGFTSSDDLELAENLGGFARLSWNDGQNESWAFAEIDQSAAAGLDWKPASWGRPQDAWGVAEVVNGLSGAHRRYLSAGGRGFMLGDGALHYGPEMLTESYYRWQALAHLAVSPDAQFVINPAYNRARGPVPIWGVRVHAEF